MKKQMYIQPEIEISRLATMNIVCASGEVDETDEAIGGDAPLRKLF